MLHRMTVKEPYFSKLREGSKTVELRLFDDKRKKIKPGDNIEFTSSNDDTQKFTVKVTGLYIAENFNCLLSLINPEVAGFESATELLGALKQFYSEDAQKKFGVVGIKVEI